MLSVPVDVRDEVAVLIVVVADTPEKGTTAVGAVQEHLLDERAGVSMQLWPIILRQ